ncbi:MAG: tetratricopeptide repeat protein, partial [Kofleriaceae bacterium]
RRWLIAGGGFAAGALAAAAIAVVLVRGPQQPSLRASYATVQSTPTARVQHARTITTTGIEEVVRVHDGTVRLAVTPASNGDRVRVQTADASLEGAGSYELVVAGDQLRGVNVATGSVMVTVQGQPRAIYLAAGQSWHPTVETTDLAVGQPPAVSPAPPSPDVERQASAGATAVISKPDAGRSEAPSHHAQRPTATVAQPLGSQSEQPPRSHVAPEQPSVPEPARMPAVTELAPAAPPADQVSATEQHFRAGVALLRGGKANEAAAELALAADGNDSLAADARYFQATALIKANRNADAEAALVRFLGQAPTSSRRGRAAVMLGRLLADRGDLATARKWFESAVGDPDPAVADAARAALAQRAR